MGIRRLLIAAAVVCLAASPLLAAEGSSVAGPIGGTDIRSAQLPPPGLYGGTIQVYAEAYKFFDGEGHLVAALSGLELARTRIAPFLLYVPDVKILGGSIGFAGIVPAGIDCGRLFKTTAKQCIEGVADAYLELAWSRFFGSVRPSQFAGAYPVAEGLTIALGFGAVIPTGRYSARDAATQGLTVGNNTWDFAPIVGVTYMTKPILAEGTEISARLYWNNYLKNPSTDYSTGDLINIDFAVSERIGRFQLGVAGYYAFQVEDDRQFGVSVPPDGRRLEALTLGGVLAYDMPEHNASLKIKFLTTVIEHNAVRSPGVVLGWVRKF